MHGPAASAISVLLFALSALLVLGAARAWAKLARDTERDGQRPAIPVAAFRSAAGVTAGALVLLGLALAWAAVVALP